MNFDESLLHLPLFSPPTRRTANSTSFEGNTSAIVMTTIRAMASTVSQSSNNVTSWTTVTRRPNAFSTTRPDSTSVTVCRAISVMGNRLFQFLNDYLSLSFISNSPMASRLMQVIQAIQTDYLSRPSTGCLSLFPTFQHSLSWIFIE